MGKQRKARGSEAGSGERPLTTAFAIASRIDKTNVFFGFQLIESETRGRERQTTYSISRDTELLFAPSCPPRAPGR